MRTTSPRNELSFAKCEKKEPMNPGRPPAQRRKISVKLSGAEHLPPAVRAALRAAIIAALAPGDLPTVNERAAHVAHGTQEKGAA